MPRTGRPPLPPGVGLTKTEMRLRYEAKLKADPAKYAAHRAKKRLELAARMADPEKRARRNARDKDSNLAAQKRAHRDPLRWPSRAVIRLRHQAKLKGLPFNIEASDLVMPEVCPVLGRPFVFGEQYRDDAGPSVDRMIPALGYVKGNVKVISQRANRLKHELTDSADLLMVARYIDSIKGV